MRERIRHLRYSLQTEKVYVYWAKAFALWAGAAAAFSVTRATWGRPSTHRQVLGRVLGVPFAPALVDPHTGVERRHHLYEERLNRELKKAVAQAGTESRCSPSGAWPHPGAPQAAGTAPNRKLDAATTPMNRSSW